MNTKLVAVFLACACVVAETRPGRRKSDERGSGSEHKYSRPHGLGEANGRGRGHPDNKPRPDFVTQTVRQLNKLCDGLNNGNISNNNSLYNDVFTALGGVCTDLVTYLDSQAVSTQAPVTESVTVQDPAAVTESVTVQDPAAVTESVTVQDPATVTDRRGSRGSGGAHGGDHGGRRENRGHRENKHEYNENKARVELFKSCMWLERVQAILPADLAADLVNIFTKMEAVCAAADLVRNTVPVAAEVTTPLA